MLTNILTFEDHRQLAPVRLDRTFSVGIVKQWYSIRKGIFSPVTLQARCSETTTSHEIKELNRRLSCLEVLRAKGPFLNKGLEGRA